MKRRASGADDGRMRSDRIDDVLKRYPAWPHFAVALLCLSSIPMSAQPGPVVEIPNGPVPQAATQAATQTATQSGTQAAAPETQTAGRVTGTVVDLSGAAIPAASVTLRWSSGTAPYPATSTQTDGDGVFAFAGVGAGGFQLLVSAPGFAPRVVTGSLTEGQILTVPQIALQASASIDVEVSLSRQEIAQVQLDAEEKQRLLGFFPNFYVVYDAHPEPLTPKQKFTLAGRFVFDPVSFGITGLTAGIEQTNNTYPGYGRGPAGYGKRYAAATGDLLISTLIGNAILPSVLKQDPRYYYKGTGTVRSRVLYAIAMSVMCKGDNGHWQVNYSGIVGGLAAGGIANAYYPASDRNGVELTFVNAAIGTGESAIGNIVQEFFFRKLTPHVPKTNP